MPKKQRDQKHVHFISKAQQPKRQKRVRLIIISAILVIIVAAVSVAGWSFYNAQVKPYHQAAIKFNNVTFNMRYFINTLGIYYGNVSADKLSDYETYGDLEIEQFAGYVEQQIVRNETIKQGSLKFGVQIDHDVIKADLKKSDIPVTEEHIDILMAQELVEKQVPSTQPQVNVQAILLESENAALEAKARLQAGESFEQVSEDLSKIPQDKIVSGNLGWVTAREADYTVGSTKFGDMISAADVNVLSDPLYDDSVSKTYGYWVAKVVEKKDATDTVSAEIHVNGILVGSEQEANDVIDKLNAGADIDELAKQVSQLSSAKDYGAEVGWILKGQFNGIFDVLFDLPLNEVSGPVGENQSETKGGYWVFNILEKDDNRELTTEQENLLVEDLLERCNVELEKDPNFKVEILLTQEMRDFALNEVVASQGEGAVLIRTSSLANGVAGKNYSQQLEVYGNKKGNTWSMTKGRLPDGLSLDGSTGLISGVPKFAGVSSLTIEVNSGFYRWTQDYFLRVYMPISISTVSLPDGQVGVDYSAILEVFGESTTYTWSIITGSLPDGLNLGETAGDIYGTPTTAGTYDFTVQVDNGLQKVTQALSLSVVAETSSDS